MTAIVGILVAVATAIGASSPPVLPTAVPAEPRALQADLDFAQRTIDDASSSASSVAGAGRFEQLATLTLARRPRGVQRGIVAGLSAPAAMAMRANLDAVAALSRLTTPRRSLPPWRIESPPPAGTLLGYFKAAQATYGVPWQYLAAIELVETTFGRVHGPSTAGAQGPMQFLPATWARYGRGNMNNPRDAILGAAHFLAANGAPRDMSDALLHYNPSSEYVRAVTDYATRMRADPHAYDGYYWWQVLYERRGRLLLLPVGYPRLRPLPITLP